MLFGTVVVYLQTDSLDRTLAFNTKHSILKHAPIPAYLLPNDSAIVMYSPNGMHIDCFLDLHASH